MVFYMKLSTFMRIRSKLKYPMRGKPDNPYMVMENDYWFATSMGLIERTCRHFNNPSKEIHNLSQAILMGLA